MRRGSNTLLPVRVLPLLNLYPSFSRGTAIFKIPPRAERCSPFLGHTQLAHQEEFGLRVSRWIWLWGWRPRDPCLPHRRASIRPVSLQVPGRSAGRVRHGLNVLMSPGQLVGSSGKGWKAAWGGAWHLVRAEVAAGGVSVTQSLASERLAVLWGWVRMCPGLRYFFCLAVTPAGGGEDEKCLQLENERGLGKLVSCPLDNLNWSC